MIDALRSALFSGRVCRNWNRYPIKTLSDISANEDHLLALAASKLSRSWKAIVRESTVSLPFLLARTLSKGRAHARKACDTRDHKLSADPSVRPETLDQDLKLWKFPTRNRSREAVQALDRKISASLENTSHQTQLDSQCIPSQSTQLNQSLKGYQTTSAFMLTVGRSRMRTYSFLHFFASILPVTFEASCRQPRISTVSIIQMCACEHLLQLSPKSSVHELMMLRGSRVRIAGLMP